MVCVYVKFKFDFLNIYLECLEESFLTLCIEMPKKYFVNYRQ